MSTDSASNTADSALIRQGTVHVSGTGQATVEPDLAEIAVGVHVVGARLEPTRLAASEKMNRARQVVLDANIDQGAIQTDRLNVHYNSHEQRHHVSTSLSITVTDLTIVESLVDQLFATVGDGLELHGVTFGASDLSEASVLARQRAFEDARSKAEHLAALADRALGPVVDIVEGSAHAQGPAPRARMAAMTEAAPLPVEAGSLQQATSLQITWVLADKQR